MSELYHKIFRNIKEIAIKVVKTTITYIKMSI